MITEIKQNPLDVAIGDTVRAQREARGLTVEGAAAALSMYVTRYEAHEAGRMAFEARDLLTLAEYYGCQASDLMPEQDRLLGVSPDQKYGDAVEINDLIHHFSGIVSPALRAYFIQQIQEASVRGRKEAPAEQTNDKAQSKRKKTSAFRFLRAS